MPISFSRPTQAGKYIKIFNLPTSYSCCVRDNPLVNISANWYLVPTCTVLICPSYIFYLMKWQSISMCLVCSWNTEFSATWSEPFNSFTKPVNHTTYGSALAMLMYVHNLCELLDTTLCFFDFQEMNELPCLTMKPESDCLVLGREA